jgi:hypothetical protein
LSLWCDFDTCAASNYREYNSTFVRVTAACALLSLALVRPSPQSQASRTLHRHFDPQDRESGRYQYGPIDVAPGTEALTISYRYSGDDGTNVIDFVAIINPVYVAVRSRATVGDGL